MHHRESRCHSRSPAVLRRCLASSKSTQPKARGLPSGRPVEKLNCPKDYIMPALVPLLAGLLEANSCMVSRMYLCGFTAVS